jgi:DNA-binding MarR family transcriptional regulator
MDDVQREQAKAAAVMAMAHADLAGADELSARVFRAFLTALRLHRQLMIKTLASRGTHPGQAFCLRLLAASDGITQRDLAETLHLSRPTVTKMLQAMEKADMIERRPDPIDRRLTRVYLTDGGRDRELALRAVSAAYVAQTIGTLPEGDRRELARLLDELAESMTRAMATQADAAAGAVAGEMADGPVAEDEGPAA